MILEDIIEAAAKRRAARKAEDEEDAAVGDDALARIYAGRQVHTAEERAATLHKNAGTGR